MQLTTYLKNVTFSTKREITKKNLIKRIILISFFYTSFLMCVCPTIVAQVRINCIICIKRVFCYIIHEYIHLYIYISQITQGVWRRQCLGHHPQTDISTGPRPALLFAPLTRSAPPSTATVLKLRFVYRVTCKVYFFYILLDSDS